MAKILYGVLGDTHGHVIRSTTIAAGMPEHEYHFVGGGPALERIAGRYPILEVPGLRAAYERERINVPATFSRILALLARTPRVVGRIRALIRDWRPDMAICDHELFLPIACRVEGVRCVSVKHSGLLLSCRYPVPSGQRLSWLLTTSYDRLLMASIRENYAVSFYHPAIKPGYRKRARLLPPVVRPRLRDLGARDGEHVLAYLTSPAFSTLIPALRAIERPVVAYGFLDEERVEGNVTFREPDEHRILEELSTCAYAVTNAGHNLLSEAFYFGKPVLCFPFANQFEQYLNAYYVRELGYGDFSTESTPDPRTFIRFESRLGTYRERLSERDFYGTDTVIAFLRALIEESTRNPPKRSPSHA